ncbi:MAG: prolipoprotein diacylglyceryl transferase [Alphaproteobacteria bacterium]|nr:prolipoprotein diacylglyceryl transferase [Alphaproteobacteria bacterium]MCL2505557.1 prolipoprotein diacylglyceryl transferase [Alphaproteobacteria bacterium]
MIVVDVDPVAFSIGPVAVYWYGLAYIIGIIAALFLSIRLTSREESLVSPKLFDGFLIYAVIGVIVGGRLGHVLFYDFSQYLSDPLEILKTWKGGMSFHGGMLGVIIAAYFYCRAKKIHFFAFTDILAVVVPIGLGLGRVANFINGELFGKATSLPWGVVFRSAGDIPRHPTQLYEAFAEGLLLFFILLLLYNIPAVQKRRGIISGAFLLLYGVFRFLIEFLKMPEPQNDFIIGNYITIGHALCLPMIAAGIIIILWSVRTYKKEFNELKQS